MECALYFGQRFVEDPDRGLGFAPREDERRRETDRILSGAVNEESPLERGVDGEVALVGRTLLRLTIADELDANHQSTAADVADDRMALGQRLQPSQQMRPYLRGIGDEPLLQ